MLAGKNSYAPRLYGPLRATIGDAPATGFSLAIIKSQTFRPSWSTLYRTSSAYPGLRTICTTISLPLTRPSPCLPGFPSSVHHDQPSKPAERTWAPPSNSRNQSTPCSGTGRTPIPRYRPQRPGDPSSLHLALRACTSSMPFLVMMKALSEALIRAQDCWMSAGTARGGRS